MKQRTSALERLRSLPPLFRGADLTVRFQWTSKTASHYLYLWKRRSLVHALGGHSDVFANLLVAPRPDWDAAVRLAMPSAVGIGVDALRKAGWTTQIQRRPTLAVNKRDSVFSTEPFEIVGRSPEWFDLVRPGIEGYRDPGLPLLRPAWALADMLHIDGWGHCGLHPDDIEWDEVTGKDEADWQKACAAFGLPCIPLHQQVVVSR